MNTNATYETRNGEVLQCVTLADHRLSCGMGAKIGLLLPPPRGDAVASSSPVRTFKLTSINNSAFKMID